MYGCIMTKEPDARRPSVDEVFGRYGKEPSVQLTVKLIDEPESERLVLFSGDRRAMRFMSEVFAAMADSPHLPATSFFGPENPGCYHVSPDSNIIVYMQVRESPEHS